MTSSTSSNSSTFSNSSSAHNTSLQESIESSPKSFCSNSAGLGNIAGQTSPARWNIGLVNSENKYLTAENFGFKINATGNTLRKKQKWMIEQDQNDEFVYLISPLGNYLGTDKYGKVSCDKLSPEEDCKFYLEANCDGKWAFKSSLYGYYFGGTGDRLHCFSKTPEWWTVHLAIHPQVSCVLVCAWRLVKLYFWFKLDQSETCASEKVCSARRR
jgi:fascin 1/2